MTNKNEEILDVLEEKDIEYYTSKYYELGNKIEEMLGKLKNCGCACDCDDEDYFTTYTDDNKQDLCLKCGGFLEW